MTKLHRATLGLAGVLGSLTVWPALLVAQTLPALPPPPVRVVETPPATPGKPPASKPAPVVEVRPDPRERRARVAAEQARVAADEARAAAEQRAAALAEENRRLRAAAAEKARLEALLAEEQRRNTQRANAAAVLTPAQPALPPVYSGPAATGNPPRIPENRLPRPENPRMQGIILDDGEENGMGSSPATLPPPPPVPVRPAPRVGQVFRDCPECPEMVVLPRGDFIMGSTDGPDEQPLRRIRIHYPLAVGRFEVTFDEWDACIAAGGCSYRPDDEGWGRGRFPVVNIGWDDAQHYLRWLSRRTGKVYRLLSESEWEYAARAGRSNSYWSFGDDPGLLGEYAWFRDNSEFEGLSRNAWKRGLLPTRMPHPVGQRQPNAFGLYDMHGNVREWVQDCYQPDYGNLPANGDALETDGCRQRVLRGGSANSEAGQIRSAARESNLPLLGPGMRLTAFHTGFRVARTLQPAAANHLP